MRESSKLRLIILQGHVCQVCACCCSFLRPFSEPLHHCISMRIIMHLMLVNTLANTKQKKLIEQCIPCISMRGDQAFLKGAVSPRSCWTTSSLLRLMRSSVT